MTNCNIQNRTIFCHDNLDVLRGINSECIDLIYLDPPFNKNKKFTAPIGSSAEGAEFSDIFREEDVKADWLVAIKEDQPELFHYLNGIRGVGNPYNFAYLAYMAIRLIECQRILKKTASIYLHCDPTMSHYLKALMDCIFGEKNFINEVVWCYKSGGASPDRYFSKKHDVILFYAKTNKYRFTKQIEKSYNRELKQYGFKGVKEYLDKVGWHTLVGMKDYWNIDMVGRTSKERTGYPTQKPLALLERIIKASSNDGDIVLDPFCGCATTCVSSEYLNRKWIGIDTSFKAYELVNEGIKQDSVSFSDNIYMKTSPPKRTDLDKDYREQKFVYIISHPSYPDEYKVGIARNAQSRLVAYQTADPERAYKIKYKLKTPYFREIEQHIHEIFPNKHEWVQGELDDIIKAIENYKIE